MLGGEHIPPGGTALFEPRRLAFEPLAERRFIDDGYERSGRETFRERGLELLAAGGQRRRVFRRAGGARRRPSVCKSSHRTRRHRRRCYRYSQSAPGNDVRSRRRRASDHGFMGRPFLCAARAPPFAVLATAASSSNCPERRCAFCSTWLSFVSVVDARSSSGAARDSTARATRRSESLNLTFSAKSSPDPLPRPSTSRFRPRRIWV